MTCTFHWSFSHGLKQISYDACSYYLIKQMVKISLFYPKQQTKWNLNQKFLLLQLNRSLLISLKSLKFKTLIVFQSKYFWTSTCTRISQTFVPSLHQWGLLKTYQCTNMYRGYMYATFLINSKIFLPTLTTLNCCRAAIKTELWAIMHNTNSKINIEVLKE